MFKKIMIMFASFVLVTLLGMGAFLGTIYLQSTGELSAATYKGFGDETDVIAATKPMTILLMGVDTGSGASRQDKWEGNSDSMILLSVNPKTKETTMMSLERDILTRIGQDGQTAEAKLNAAYANGGAKLAIETVQDLMNIHVDRYILINMEGLVQLVDAVGGIEVTNEFDFPISIEENEPEFTAKVEPGTHTINGQQALVYARMRYQDPDGDYGRQKRQREVISKVVKKVLSANSVGHYQDVLKAVRNNLQTNIDLSAGSIPQLLGYQDAFKKIKNEQLRGEDAIMPDGGSYQIVKKSHMLEMQNLLRKSLGKETVDKVKTNAVLWEEIYEGETPTSGSRSSSNSTPSYEEPAPAPQTYETVPAEGYYYE